jgi:hypothetical protein
VGAVANRDNKYKIRQQASLAPFFQVVEEDDDQADVVDVLSKEVML